MGEHLELVAELCQNHGGSRPLLERLVWAAAEAGADIAKIQAIYAADLTYRDRYESPPIGDGRLVRPYEAEFARLSALELKPADEEWFVRECARAGLRSMITIFAPHHAVRLHGLGFDEVKIASAACGDVELIHSVASLWPRVYLSTGGATALELRSARSAADARGLVLLHCVCEYPTATHRANLGRLRWLRLYADVVGFSDHSDAGVLTASKAAIAMGADVIERHFTLLPKADTKDGVVSIGPTHLAELRAFSKLPRSEQTAELNEWIQLFDSAVGERPSGEEQRNLEYHSRRLRRRPEGEVDHVGV